MDKIQLVMHKVMLYLIVCTDPESLVSEGPTLTIFILVDERFQIPLYHYMRAIIGQPAQRNLNGVSLACR